MQQICCKMHLHALGTVFLNNVIWGSSAAFLGYEFADHVNNTIVRHSTCSWNLEEVGDSPAQISPAVA